MIDWYRILPTQGMQLTLKALALAAVPVAVPALADPVQIAHRLHVSISVGGASGTDRFDPGFREANTSDALAIGYEFNPSAAFRSTVPDSTRFEGLAGALNLAIDTSNGQPVVDGIQLSPGETLRFVAGEEGRIRGIQGQISIRLDF